MQLLKQSTAYTFQLGPFVDSTDGVTPEASLTIAATDVDVSKNGAAFGDKNDATALTGTGDAQGYYDCVLDTTDTGTLGKLDVRCYVSGALPVWKEFMVVTANVYDSLCSTDVLDVSVTQWLGTAAHAATVAGVPVVQLHENGGGGGVNAPLNFEDLNITDTTGLVRPDMANASGNYSGTVGKSPATLAAADVSGNLPVDLQTIKTQTVTCSAGVTVLASVGTAATSTAQTGDTYALANGASGFANIKSDTAAILTDTGTTLENHLTGIKGATFDTATDSLEAIRNRGDAAWITATGFSTLDAAGVRTAVGLASANLDTQLAALPTDADVNAQCDTAISDAALATAAALATVDANVDSILADTGTDGVVVAAASKTGYALAATGLDSITATRPAAVATTFPQMLVQLFYRFFGKSTLTSTQLKTYAANGTTVVTTQTVSDDNTTQTQGEAS